jgi:transposase
MQVTTLGIDLAKNVFRAHGCDAGGKVAVSKSLTRRQLQIFVATLSPCLVGMEAAPQRTTGRARFRSMATRCG